MSPHLVVFLGNPGSRYAETRHNIAWWVADNLAARRHLAFESDAQHYALARGRVGGQVAILLKPLTYMNESGRAVSDLIAQEEITSKHILIVSDDIDLPLGQIRVRQRGSSGGHRGLESIFEHLGTEDLARCRCGVGPVPSGGDPAEFVLDPFGPNELIAAREMATVAADVVEMILARGVAAAANVYNRRPSAPQTPPNGEGATRPREDE
jgi:PTH1 family peptidyl-tRNA hydrolase